MNNKPSGNSQYERLKRIGVIFLCIHFVASIVFFLMTFKLSSNLCLVILITGILYTLLTVSLALILVIIKKQFRAFLLPATFSLYLIIFEYYDSILHRMSMMLRIRDILQEDITVQMAFLIHVGFIFIICSSWYLTNEIYKHRKNSITVFSHLKNE